MRKYTQQEAEQLFEDHGFVLHDVYINTHTPMNALCSCGTKTRTALHSVLHGHHCAFCKESNMRQQFALSQKYVAEKFAKRGYTLLSQYFNCFTKLQCKCPNGHLFTIRWNDFNKGVGCAICARFLHGHNEQGDKHYRWNPDRIAVLRVQKVAHQHRELLRRCRKQMGTAHESDSIEELGYSAKELREHIEAHWNYAFVQNGPWAIDHILPIKAFHDHGIFDAQVINALENLMPRSQHDNSEKKDWYREEDFLQYCAKHNIVVQPSNKEILS